MKRIDFLRGASQRTDAMLAVRGLEQATAEAFKATQEAFRAPFTFVVASKNTTARPWDFILCNTDLIGALTILLPSPNLPEVIGAIIVIKNDSALSNSITVKPLTGTIDGDQATTISTPRGVAYVTSTGTEWKKLFVGGGLELPPGSLVQSYLRWDTTLLSWQPRNNIPRAMDNRFAPVANYDFTRGFPHGIVDQSGNGYDLSLAGGFQRYSWIHPAVQAYVSDGTNILVRSAATAALAMTGAMSYVIIGSLEAYPTAIQYLISHGGDPASALAVNNFLYGNRLRPAADQYVMGHFHEHTAGTGVTFDIGSAWAAPNQFFIWGQSRTASAGTVTTHYWNQGYEWSSATATALTAPDGGGSGRFRLFGSSAGNAYRGLCAQVVVYNYDIGASGHLDHYNYCLGDQYGYKESP